MKTNKIEECADKESEPFLGDKKIIARTSFISGALNSETEKYYMRIFRTEMLLFLFEMAQRGTVINWGNFKREYGKYKSKK